MSVVYTKKLAHEFVGQRRLCWVQLDVAGCEPGLLHMALTLGSLLRQQQLSGLALLMTDGKSYRGSCKIYYASKAFACQCHLLFSPAIG